MIGHGPKLSPRKDEALTALLTQPTVAEAARVAKIRPQTLSLWMKEPEFEAAWRAARSFGLEHAIARLQKISGTAVSVLLKVMHDSTAPAGARLKAAETVLKHARVARELDIRQARLTELERATKASKLEIVKPPAREVPGSPISGHGAKYNRRMEDAIAALLTKRSVDEAALVVEIGPQTLYRWMKYPDFQDAWREARRGAFGQANTRLQQALGSAVTTIMNVMGDPTASASTRVRATDLSLTLGEIAIEEDIEARLAALGYDQTVAQAVRQGDKRSFDEIAKDPVKAAA